MEAFKQFLTFNIPETDLPRVVIIGGGFAGINLAKKLDGNKFQIVLLDLQNYHMFQPLLYQVATAGLEPDSIASPFRKILQGKKNFYFRNLKVKSIDPVAKEVSTVIGELAYDYLVMATGTKTNFFGNEKIAEAAFPLKRVGQALDLRSQVFQSFEAASMAKSIENQDRLSNFVIVGGGPTGVEVSGALAELKKYILPKDYPDLDFDLMRIILVEGNDRLLAGMSEAAGKRAQKDLERMGVQLIFSKFVTDFEDGLVVLDDGETIVCETLIWAAGVKGALIDGLEEEQIERSRIKVDGFNQVEGFNDLFALGDIALMKTEAYPNGHPQVAQPAIQQANLLAKNLNKSADPAKWKSFKYFDKGSMATIGRNRAVADLPKGFYIGGFFAWAIWIFIHVFFLIGFKNKITTFWNWIYNYFTLDRGARLIIRPFVRKGDVLRETFVRENQPG